MADLSGKRLLEFRDSQQLTTSKSVTNVSDNEILGLSELPRATHTREYNTQKTNQTRGLPIAPPKDLSTTSGYLNIRTPKSELSSTNDQVVREPPQTNSIVNPVVQAPRKHIIDLTEDDDDEVKLSVPPRKKSRSSSGSSDLSDRVIQFKPVRAARQASKVPGRSEGYNKRRAISPPSSPFLALNSFSNGQRSSHSSTPEVALRRSSPPSYEASSKLSKLPLTLQQQPNPRQYASAVIVQSDTGPRPDPTPEETQERQAFLQNLSLLQGPNIRLTNTIDNTSPPTSFQFISASILRPDVHRAPNDVMVGCSCRKKHGGNECKYPNYCNCLKDSGGDAAKKRSQYHEGVKRGCLMPHVLKNRFNIYECNLRCDCSDDCKNRVVQWGRQVRLEIFKTGDGRGWGLRCLQDLQEGQFVDTYRGEVITTEEADKRKKAANEDNYLFDFDKFEEAKYVCDGKDMGGPTRFMNHSCRPNCALFTVTYNHYDSYLYELAFFATEPIARGTELTFDYADKDVLEGESERKITAEMAKDMERKKGYAPSVCRCGAKDCRGYFFFSKD